MTNKIKSLNYTHLIHEEKIYNFNLLLIYYFRELSQKLQNRILETGEDEEDDNFIESLIELEEEENEKKVAFDDFKGRQDVGKIQNIIDFFSNVTDLNIFGRLSQVIKKDRVEKSHLAFLKDEEIINNFYIIFNDYKNIYATVYEDIEQSIGIKLSSGELSELDNGDIIDEIREIFISAFTDLLMYISQDNQEKADIIEQVFKAQNGDEGAKEAVTNIMLYEATQLSRKYVYRNGVYNEQLASDLIQEALLNGYTGITKYDVSKNDNFICYIRYWLRLGIFNYLEIHSNQIRIPSHIKQLTSKIQKIISSEHIENEHADESIDTITHIIYEQNMKTLKERKSKYEKAIRNKEYDTEEKKEYILYKIEEISSTLADKTQKEKLRAKVKNAIEKKDYNNVFTMEQLLQNVEDGDEGRIEDALLEDKSYNITESLIAEEDKEKLLHFIKTVLNEEEMTVIAHREGLFSHDQLLLGTLGRKLDKSAERVRQIFTKAMQKLSIKSFDDYTTKLQYSVVDKKFYLNNK